MEIKSFDKLGDQACGDSSAAFSDIESLAWLNAHRLVCLADHLNVVAWHSHLALLIGRAFWPVEVGRFI